MQVLAFMAAAAALLLFQLVFASARRRSRSPLLHAALWLAHAVVPTLTAYALGLMTRSSPARTAAAQLYPVWALSLLLLAGGAGAPTAHGLADHAHWARRLLVHLQCYLFFTALCRQLLSSGSAAAAVTVPVALLAATAASSLTLGLRASSAAGDPAPSKALADHMKHEVEDHAADAEAAAAMNGGKYLVHWPRHKVVAALGGTSPSSAAAYRCELPSDGDVITVGMVWELCDGDGDAAAAAFASLGGAGITSRIKGACLSYALSHLLKRRFFGFDCAEAGHAQTRGFVLEGMLAEDNDDEHTEAFRVIEAELAFLHDFFFTKYGSVFEAETTFFFTAALKIILTFVLAVVVVLKSYFLLDNIPVTESTPRTIDVAATVLVLGVFIAVEAAQMVMYLGSDWAMVSLACSRLTAGSNRFLPLAIRKAFGFLCRRRLFSFSYWHNSLGQYSVIESSRFLRRSNAFSFETESEPMLMFSVTAEYLSKAWGNLTTSKGLHFVKLPDTLKPQIVSLLKSNTETHPLSNGKASLLRNGVSRQLLWTLQNEMQTENMLIWHIATDYLTIALPDDDAKESSQRQSMIYQNREVATKLSRYCAYLMSEAPELLPGNSVETRFVFDHAMYEARETLGSGLRKRDQLRKVLTSSRDDDAGTIFIKGIKLGAKLESIREVSICWKLMAEFWLETILYIAPSENAKAHMERLARGGEFLTHIWALLTHTGILTRNPEPIPD